MTIASGKGYSDVCVAVHLPVWPLCVNRRRCNKGGSLMPSRLEIHLLLTHHRSHHVSP